MKLTFRPIWFDSLGAKSACTLVKTSDISILLEPGISIMHDSFVGSTKQKQTWFQNGFEAIQKAASLADILVCSHYHHDHFFHDDFEIYGQKTLLIKNPNEFINDTQYKRAEQFFGDLYHHFDVSEEDKISSLKINNDYGNPLDSLPRAKKMDYGDYNARKKELMNKGRNWFDRRVCKWKNHSIISETITDDLTVIFPEEKELSFGNTLIRCSKPLFHGIEFARVGWVFTTIIEHAGKKLLHTSDICGPIIEDYASFIINENPDILILDGPPTYMYGYMLTTINLQRTIDNAIEIIKNIDAECIIYDHHLTRDKRFIKRTKPVWDTATKYGKNLVTAAEHLGQTPVVLQYD